MMDSKKLAQLCVELAENRKGENPLVLDVRKLTSVTSFFVVVTGTSDPHLRAIRDEIVTQLQEQHELKPLAVDGELRSSWVVLDYSDVIVHLLLKETREKYDLESLWGDAPRVKKTRAKAAKESAGGAPVKTPRPRRKTTVKKASSSRPKAG